MDVTPVNAHATALPQDSASSGSALPNSQGLNDMFLQLLVAQLQHQSPLEPMDPTQFVGQLAQFSELSEVTQINQLLQKELGPASTSSHAEVSSAKPKITANPASVAIPDAMISSAVQAARAGNAYSPRSTSIPNSQIEGVY